MWINYLKFLFLLKRNGFFIVSHSIETSSRRSFFFFVSKRGTHFAHSFLMSKFSVNMRCTAHFQMPTMSASSCTFSRRSSNTILWIFFTISVVVTSFGRSLRCLVWQFVRSRLNSATQYFIVVNEGADSPRVHGKNKYWKIHMTEFSTFRYVQELLIIGSTVLVQLDL